MLSWRKQRPIFARCAGVKIVAAIPAISLLSGCAAGLFWPDLSILLLCSVLFGSAIAAVATVRAQAGGWFIAAIVAGFASGGALLGARAWEAVWRPSIRAAFESMARAERTEALRRGRARPENDSATMLLTGVLRTDASLTPGGGVSLNLASLSAAPLGPSDAPDDSATHPGVGGVLLVVNGSIAGERADEWRAGRTIRAPALVRRPSRYLNPGVPDQERALARRGVRLIGTVKSGALVEVVARGSPLMEAAAAARAFARRAIAATVGRWSPQSAGIVAAIVIGDRSGLGDDVERRLQEAGTYHVIAISGGNIAILAALIVTLFRTAGLFGRGAMVSAIAVLVAYALLTGGGASVNRATLMAAIYFGGRVLDLRGPPLNVLATAAAVLVAADPLAVADPGFLLTFGATAAILAGASSVSLSRLPRFLVPTAALGVASLSAEVALIPIAALLFSRVTFAGLALNFLAIPLMAAAQIAGMLVVPVWAVWPWLAAFAGFAAHVGATGLVRSADLLIYAPWTTWRVPAPSALAIAAYYAGVLSSWWLWHRRVHVFGSRESRLARVVRGSAAAMAVLAAVWILNGPWRWWPSAGDGRLHVTFIDVGQGDSAFVVFPRGATLLVDSGGVPRASSFDVGERVVAPALRRAGVRRLGTLALTHADADHVGGARAIIREFRPWDIWDGVPVPASETVQELRRVAQGSRSRWTNLQTADETLIDDVRVTVWHPPRPDWERQTVRNDDSIVFELRWRDVSFVLTGDIGREIEHLLIERIEPAPLRVVKVPHHGSLTSSSEAFVQALNPRLAVVSVGRSNSFGHPAGAVLARYHKAGATVFRTDRDGAVTVDTDGTSLSVHAFTGRRIEIGATHHEGTKTTTIIRP